MESLCKFSTLGIITIFALFVQGQHVPPPYGVRTSSNRQRFSPVSAHPSIVNLETQCFPEGISVTVTFDQPFSGVVYSSGYFGQQNCEFSRGNPGSAKTQLSFGIPANSCGTKDNKLSKSLSAVLIFQMDEDVQEIWDISRKVSCTYSKPGDTHEKMVIFKPLSVGMLDVQRHPIKSEELDCWMDIQIGKYPNTAPIEGQIPIGEELSVMIFLKDEEKQYDVRVKDCWAFDSENFEDSKTSKVQLTGYDGCTKKVKLIGPWDKTLNTGNSGATIISYTNMTAFKFPNSDNVHLSCNMELCRGVCPPNSCTAASQLTGEVSSQETSPEVPSDLTTPYQSQPDNRLPQQRPGYSPVGPESQAPGSFPTGPTQQRPVSSPVVPAQQQPGSSSYQQPGSFPTGPAQQRPGSGPSQQRPVSSPVVPAQQQPGSSPYQQPGSSPLAPEQQRPGSTPVGPSYQRPESSPVGPAYQRPESRPVGPTQQRPGSSPGGFLSQQQGSSPTGPEPQQPGINLGTPAPPRNGNEIPTSDGISRPPSCYEGSNDPRCRTVSGNTPTTFASVCPPGSLKPECLQYPGEDLVEDDISKASTPPDESEDDILREGNFPSTTDRLTPNELQNIRTSPALPSSSRPPLCYPGQPDPRCPGSYPKKPAAGPAAGRPFPTTYQQQETTTRKIPTDVTYPREPVTTVRGCYAGSPDPRCPKGSTPTDDENEETVDDQGYIPTRTPYEAPKTTNTDNRLPFQPLTRKPNNCYPGSRDPACVDPYTPKENGYFSTTQGPYQADTATRRTPTQYSTPAANSRYTTTNQPYRYQPTTPRTFIPNTTKKVLCYPGQPDPRCPGSYPSGTYVPNALDTLYDYPTSTVTPRKPAAGQYNRQPPTTPKPASCFPGSRDPQCSSTTLSYESENAEQDNYFTTPVPYGPAQSSGGSRVTSVTTKSPYQTQPVPTTYQPQRYQPTGSTPSQRFPSQVSTKAPLCYPGQPDPRCQPVKPDENAVAQDEFETDIQGAGQYQPKPSQPTGSSQSPSGSRVTYPSSITTISPYQTQPVPTTYQPQRYQPTGSTPNQRFPSQVTTKSPLCYPGQPDPRCPPVKPDEDDVAHNEFETDIQGAGQYQPKPAQPTGYPRVTPPPSLFEPPTTYRSPAPYQPGYNPRPAAGNPNPNPYQPKETGYEPKQTSYGPGPATDKPKPNVYQSRPNEYGPTNISKDEPKENTYEPNQYGTTPVTSKPYQKEPKPDEYETNREPVQQKPYNYQTSPKPQQAKGYVYRPPNGKPFTYDSSPVGNGYSSTSRPVVCYPGQIDPRCPKVCYEGSTDRRCTRKREVIQTDSVICFADSMDPRCPKFN